MAFSDFRITDIENALQEARQAEDPTEKLNAVVEAVQAVLGYIKEKTREEESAARRIRQSLDSHF